MKKTRRLSFAGFMFILFAALLAAAALALGGVSRGSDSDCLQAVEDALVRAAVECYALEGAYPPNAEYLEENYGVTIDHEKYFVHYKLDGANLRPDIQVFQKAGA